MVVSTNEDSCGLALPGDSAISRPFASQMAMILLPFPFFVSPITSPFFGRDEGGIDKGFLCVNYPPAYSQGHRAFRKQIDETGIDPFLISSMCCLM